MAITLQDHYDVSTTVTIQNEETGTNSTLSIPFDNALPNIIHLTASKFAVITFALDGILRVHMLNKYSHSYVTFTAGENEHYDDNLYPIVHISSAKLIDGFTDAKGGLIAVTVIRAPYRIITEELIQLSIQ